VIVVVGLLAYSNNLHGKLVLDDQAILAGNEHIRSLKNIPRLFGLNWWGMTPVPAAGAVYRPLAATSFAVDVALMGGYSADLQRQDRDSGGLDVRVLHASSIVYHVLTSFFVYLALLHLLPGDRRALWAAAGALLFAAHPVHVEAVTGHVGRAEVMSGLFFFAAAAAFLHGVRDERPNARLGWAIGSAVLWLAALLSKEMAVTLPAFLALVEWARGQRRPPGRWVALYAPFVGAGIVYAVMRRVALGDQIFLPGYEALPAASVSYGQRLMTMAHALALDWKLIVFPTRLSADYTGFPVARSAASLVVWGSFALHAVLIGVAVWALRRGRSGGPAWLRAIGLGIAGFYLLIFPVSNILVNTGVVVSERALFIPSFAPLLAAVAVLGRAEEAIRQPATKWAPAVVAGVLIVAGIVGCRAANLMWADETTLFTASVRSPYAGYLAYSGLARTYYIQGEYEKALDFANQSIALRMTAVNLGRKADCLFRLNRYEEAIEPLELLLRNRKDASTLRKLVSCYTNLGREGDALEVMAKYPDLTQSSGLDELRRRLEDSSASDKP